MIIKNKEPYAYSYLIFDLDGTLVDSCPDIIETIKYIIDRYGFDQKEDAFIRSCIGGGARNVLIKSLGEDKETLIDHEILPLFVEYYTENCDKKTFAYDGVLEVLEYYKQKGKSLSVATFKIRRATEKILKTLKLYDYFDILVTADDVKNPKPHPDCINAILAYYNCSKTQAILVGDTKTDYLTGTNAGIDVCGVTFGYGAPEVVRSLNPTYVIDRMEELKKAVL
ncbi:HAD family hydrolase [Acetobacterium carbinolicum]|uniref:HAD family hydrolase n=1 Tax=Acetobacterium TaxID=33951 RepID=UPI000DBEB90D|nr:HAD-IA family hydrolase [Acetobacterium sp. KB-1]AWW28171.1 phosphoglycolate phosphatase [Acetobacterium sp. KB-1]